MAKASSVWTVLEHEPLQKLSENLWLVRGTLPKLGLLRVMAVARLADGRLLIHSAIAVDDAVLREIEAWGTPAFLVVPSAQHVLDAPAFKHRYPNLRVLAPEGARARVAQTLAVDGSYDELPADEAVRFERLAGVGDAEGVLLVRSAGGTSVILNDAVFNITRKLPPLTWLFTAVFGSAPGPRVSRLFRLACVKDSALLRRDLERLAALPDLTRLIVSHEEMAEGRAAALALREAASYLG